MAVPKKDTDHEDRVRIAFFGMGNVATAALQLCRQRPWIKVVGAVRSPVSGSGENKPVPVDWLGVEIWDDPDEMLDQAHPDVALIATRSAMGAVLPDIKRCASRGVDVVCSSEEMAWPDFVRPGTILKLNRLAVESNVAIKVTGINPGFMFDVLPLLLAATSWDVAGIQVGRTLDASVFGREVHRSLGIGYTKAEFFKAREEGRIRGHIGFAESMHVIVNHMGVHLEHLTDTVEGGYSRPQIRAGRSHDPPWRDCRGNPGSYRPERRAGVAKVRTLVACRPPGCRLGDL